MHQQKIIIKSTHPKNPNSDNVPELRFPEFNYEWSPTKLIELCTLQRGFDLTKSTRVDGEYPVYSSSGVSYYHNEFKVQGPGIITGRKGVVGSVFYIKGPHWPHDTTLWVKDFHNNDVRFVYWFLLYFRLERFEASSSVPTLNRNSIHGIKIRIPKIQEQQKIASFLTAVDKRIQLLQKKKAKLEEYKKGVMQKLFPAKAGQTPEIRFKDENGNNFPEWEEKRLGEVCDILGGGTPSTSNKEFWNGDINWFTPTEIKSKYINTSLRKITIEGVSKSSAKLLPVDTLLFTSRATVGEVGISLEPCTTNQGFQSFLPNENYSTEFLYYWIVKNRKEFVRKSSGSTFIEISKFELNKINISLPSLLEQQKIASFLSSLDKSISSIGKQIETSTTFKKGLLQKMFV